MVVSLCNYNSNYYYYYYYEWWCHLRDVHDPFLAIYNDCAGQRDKLLVSQCVLQLVDTS